MPKIIPFRAVRPTRDKVGLIAARSYQSYSESERKARLDTNPFSFLHIVNPGYKYKKEISGTKRYELVRNRYQEFKEENYFLRDEKPAYYLHKIVNRNRQTFYGIVGAASVADYENNTIKKHEDTIADREDTFKEYLKTVGFNAEPVLLAYPDNDILKDIFEKVSSERAEYEFTTTYKDTHYLWIVNDEKYVEEIKKQFAKMDKMYIADGHHRSASSYLLAQDKREENPEHTGEEPYNFFMSYCIPESNLIIHEFNRLVKDLNGLDKEEFLIKLDTYFRIENLGETYYKPGKKGHFSMYLDGDFYSLYLRKQQYQYTDALSKLDVQILYETVLKPILGIEDLRNDDRISYTHGKGEMASIKGYVDSGEYAVGFGMLPSTIDEVKQIADENLVMPPKATYIEPKLRSGITIYEF